MQATDILMHEHRIIEQVLNCLNKIVDQCEASKKLDAESAERAFEFLHGFADRCHQRKEESILFPTMQIRGFAGDCSPVVVMLREHELGRLYLQSTEAATKTAAGGDRESLGWFVQHGQSYLRLIREHIHKEDTCLFPAANHHLTQQDQEQLLTAFEEFETTAVGHGSHEMYLAVANELADHFGVPRATDTHCSDASAACRH